MTTPVLKLLGVSGLISGFVASSFFASGFFTSGLFSRLCNLFGCLLGLGGLVTSLCLITSLCAFTSGFGGLIRRGGFFCRGYCRSSLVTGRFGLFCWSGCASGSGFALSTGSGSALFSICFCSSRLGRLLSGGSGSCSLTLPGEKFAFPLRQRSFFFARGATRVARHETFGGRISNHASQE